VVISEKCTINTEERILSREVVVEKTADSKESLNITIKAPTLGGQAQAKIGEETVKQPEALKSVRPVHATGQTGSVGGVPITGQTRSPYRPDWSLSPWMAENFQAEESREREVEDR
jgi:hypothetical protein